MACSLCLLLLLRTWLRANPAGWRCLCWQLLGEQEALAQADALWRGLVVVSTSGARWWFSGALGLCLRTLWCQCSGFPRPAVAG